MTTALLLVDLQHDFLSDPRLEPRADFVIARAAALLEGCRRRGMPIVHIWTTVRREDDRRLPHWRARNIWRCVAGTPGHRPPDALMPLEGERLIHKTGFNPFSSGALAQLLGEWNCRNVWLAGVHLHACVRTTAVECLERNIPVGIAEDATGSNDPVHAAATRRWLRERCVAFESVSRLLAHTTGSAPDRLIHRCPRDLERVAFEVPLAGEAELEAAVVRSRDAWTAWRHTSRVTRCDMLEEVAVRLENALEDLARQMASEIGKPLTEGREEVRRAAVNIRDVLRRAVVDRREPAGRVGDAPLGVVAIIPAWNNPVAIPLGKLAPALAYGNTVVWKPAPAGTGIARVLMRLLSAAGLPPGTVELVTGDHDTARQLAEQDGIAAVTLTGSSAAGYALQEICARRGIPFQAELNGNNAAIVWDGANLEAAAGQLAWGAFTFAGQRCTANRRVIVSAAQFEPLLAALESAARNLVWGDPLEEATRIGPVLTAGKRDDLERELAGIQSAGRAHAIVRTHRAEAARDWVRQGAYAQPAILGCDRPEDPLVQEESMAPWLILQRAEDFDHALELGNGVRQGLIASLFGGSRGLRDRFRTEARAGVLKFDQGTAGVDVTLPFGGWKSSGVGPPEHGEADRLFYTRLQAIYGAVDPE